MITIPIQTRILNPPQDDLLEAIRASALELQERDVVVVSSKVVAIHEGRCVKREGSDKDALVREEADVFVSEADSRWRLCMKDGVFLAGAGIDESNANEHLVLLPKDSQKSAKMLHTFMKDVYDVNKLGVIVVDSHSVPMRYGTVGVALGWHGLEPVTYFTGKPDLFGRPSKFTRINVADSLATAGVFVMGEMAEQTPLCVVREAPHLRLTERDTSRELTIPPREDIYWPLLKHLYEQDEQ